MKYVVITGAAGFIGSHLCDKFIKKGFKVIGIDNFITGSPKNIEHLHNLKNFKFINQDVTIPIELHEKIHLVLHFASPASPLDYLNFPLETLKVNSIGTLNSLKLAKKCDSRFILASTSEVYGDPKVNPQHESYWGNVNPVGPRSVYDEAKRFSEAVTMSYFREYGLDTRIIRIFNTYGSRMKANDGRVIPNFITQSLNNKPITVYGKGTQTRSFCYIDDLIDGIYKISNTNNLNGKIMNLGNPEEYTINKLASMIIKKISSESKIIFKQLPEDDPKERCPDISRTKSLIEWEPKTNISRGLDKTIDYFDNLIED